jgi:hypothetical protein
LGYELGDVRANHRKRLLQKVWNVKAIGRITQWIFASTKQLFDAASTWFATSIGTTIAS